jgi:hypothetical protein
MNARRRTFGLAAVALLCLAPPAPRKPATPVQPPVAPIAFPEAPRVPLPVVLVIDDEYRERAKALRLFRMGDLAEESERLARSVFEPVTVVDSLLERTDQAGVLLPRFVDVGHAAPIAEAREREGALVVQWSFADPDGCIVWIDTFVGRGTSGWEEGQNKALRLALEDSLRQAQRALLTSPELAAYATRWTRESATPFVGPPAPDACGFAASEVEAGGGS